MNLLILGIKSELLNGEKYLDHALVTHTIAMGSTYLIIIDL